MDLLPDQEEAVRRGDPIPGLRRAVLVLRNKEWFSGEPREREFRELIHYFLPGFLEPCYGGVPLPSFGRAVIVFDRPRRWDPTYFLPVPDGSTKPNYHYIDREEMWQTTINGITPYRSQAEEAPEPLQAG